VPAGDGQTDRQTDGWTHDDIIYRASIASRDKNEPNFSSVLCSSPNFLSLMYNRPHNCRNVGSACPRTDSHAGISGRQGAVLRLIDVKLRSCKPVIIYLYVQHFRWQTETEKKKKEDGERIV